MPLIFEVARRVARFLGVQVEGRAVGVGIDVVEVGLGALALHDVAGEVQAGSVIEEVHLGADFVSPDGFRTEGGESRRTVVGAAGAIAGRIFGVEVDVPGGVDRGDDHRVDPALVVGEGERVARTAATGQDPADVDGVAVDDVENARALVLGVACADRQVEDIEAGRGPGCLAE